MGWQQGRPVIDAMLAGARPPLQRVVASRSHADVLIQQAWAHLASAEAVKGIDPEGGFALMYDASRKALVALLENQGIRPTSSGGHIATYEAVRAQLDPPLGPVLRPFDRMRRRRRDAEYPAMDVLPITQAEVEESLVKATAIIRMAELLLDEMGPL